MHSSLVYRSPGCGHMTRTHPYQTENSDPLPIVVPRRLLQSAQCETGQVVMTESKGILTIHVCFITRQIYNCTVSFISFIYSFTIHTITFPSVTPPLMSQSPVPHHSQISECFFLYFITYHLVPFYCTMDIFSIRTYSFSLSVSLNPSFHVSLPDLL